MKKALLIAAIAAGLSIPLYAHTTQFYYVLVAVILGIFVAMRRTRLTVYDFLTLFIILIPFHNFRLGTANAFLRLTELAFVPQLAPT